MDSDSGVGTDLASCAARSRISIRAGRAICSRRKNCSGSFPFGNKLRNYFDSYKSSQNHISQILVSLKSGKDELLKDNAAIDTERQNLWAAMGRLEQMIHTAQTADTLLEDKANELDTSDPAKAKAIRETALFYVRQRHQDLLTQMAVTVQGYLALDLVKKNNTELMKGVDRASDHHRRGAAHRGHGRAGPWSDRSWCWSRSPPAQRHHRQHHRFHRRHAAQPDRRDSPAGGERDHPDRDAEARLPEHLRHDGRGR